MIEPTVTGQKQINVMTVGQGNEEGDLVILCLVNALVAHGDAEGVDVRSCKLGTELTFHRRRRHQLNEDKIENDRLWVSLPLRILR